MRKSAASISSGTRCSTCLSPKRRRQFPQHFIKPVEYRRVLADHHQRQAAPGAQYPVKLIHGALDVFR